MVATKLKLQTTAPLMLRAQSQSRPWPLANCQRLNPARHVVSELTPSRCLTLATSQRGTRYGQAYSIHSQTK